MTEAETELKLEFETAAFLQSLFAHDTRQLRYLEEKLGVRAVTRDGWMLLAGPAGGVEKAKQVFADLEQARRGGAEIEARDFRQAVDVGSAGGETGMKELSQMRLLGRRGARAVVPRTPMQLEYLRAIESHEVCFGLGPAGTGKTYLAMAAGLSLLMEKVVNRVVLTRPAVEAGEALGFLPGDMREKVAPYLRPLYDAIHDMIGAETGERYLEDGTIEIAPLAFMRGRTLARSFVILDEAQNTTREQMFMTLTRLGEESRMVVTGDASQTDLKPGVPSGLTEARKALAETEGVAFVEFSRDDVIRHPVVSRIIQAYEDFREG